MIHSQDGTRDKQSHRDLNQDGHGVLAYEWRDFRRPRHVVCKHHHEYSETEQNGYHKAHSLTRLRRQIEWEHGQHGQDDARNNQVHHVKKDSSFHLYCICNVDERVRTAAVSDLMSVQSGVYQLPLPTYSVFGEIGGVSRISEI